jgi:hypothetical protein
VCEVLGIKDNDDPTYVTIAGYTHLSHMSPEKAHFAEISILGADFCNAHKVSLRHGGPPVCPFSAGGTPGTCSQTTRILSNTEIQRIITANSLTPTLDETAGVKWISWGAISGACVDQKAVPASSRC